MSTDSRCFYCNKKIWGTIDTCKCKYQKTHYQKRYKSGKKYEANGKCTNCQESVVGKNNCACPYARIRRYRDRKTPLTNYWKTYVDTFKTEKITQNSPNDFSKKSHQNIYPPTELDSFKIPDILNNPSTNPLTTNPLTTNPLTTNPSTTNPSTNPYAHDHTHNTNRILEEYENIIEHYHMLKEILYKIQLIEALKDTSSQQIEEKKNTENNYSPYGYDINGVPNTYPSINPMRYDYPTPRNNILNIGGYSRTIPGESTDLLSTPKNVIKVTCANPDCNHLTLEEDPAKVTTPYYDKIDSIDKIISIGKSYHCKKNKKIRGIDLLTVFNLIAPLEELKVMIGLEDIKLKLLDHIVYFIKGLNNVKDGKNQEMLHTVITGPPGTGKTRLARIMGKIYCKLGLLSKGHFTEVTRADMVGKYLGHTADKTVELISKCKGGVMFIDEAYQLGHPDKRDSFSKECLDALTQKLSETRDLLCIIAGYQDDIDSCFFAQNKGLKRRFPFEYNITGYTPDELVSMFRDKMETEGWEFEDGVMSTYKNKFNERIFKHYGGDIETFSLKVKIAYAKNNFYDDKRIIDSTTMKDAFIFFEKKTPEDEYCPWKRMYA